VLYDGDVCLGGGVIDVPLDAARFKSEDAPAAAMQAN
jgi:hypothetical protein